MKCHASHLPDAVLQSPHDLSVENLNLISHLPRKSPNAYAALGDTQHHATVQQHAAVSGPSKVPGQSTRCAICHIEHHGADSHINTITDARCQACHQTRFASLEAGHPQFAGYPYRTERRIQFNHQTHLEKHFAAKNELFECSRCHVDQSRGGNIGSVFRSVGFENACASCHAEPIRSSLVNGWALLQLPTILPSDAENPQFGLMDWPPSARFDYDGEIGIAARLLLEADDDARVHEALSALPASGKLSEIAGGDQPQRVRVLALAFRRLIADVARDGQAAWQARLLKVLETRLQRAPSEYELRLVRRLSAGLPPDLFRQMELQWFTPANSLAGLKPELDLSPKIGGSARPMRLASGAIQGVQPDDDDNLLGDEAQVGTDQDSRSQDSLDQDSRSQDLLDQDLLDQDLLDQDLLDQDLLGGDLLGGDLLGGDLLGGDLLGGVQDEDLLSSALEPLEDSSDSGKKEQFVGIRGASHVAEGGWYLDERLLAVRYQPTGHADETLAAWAEFVALLDRQSHPPIWSPGLAEAPTSPIPGGCADCHLLGQDDSPKRQWSNWRSIVRPDTIRLFTKFDHTPHLTLPALADCNYCHTLQLTETEIQPTPQLQASERVAQGEGFMGVTSVGFPTSRADGSSDVEQHSRLEFAPMLLTQCAACHRPGGANDGCTQCHNYHVGQAGIQWSHALGKSFGDSK